MFRLIRANARNLRRKPARLLVVAAALPLPFAVGGCVIREGPAPAYYSPETVDASAEEAPYEPAPQQVLVQYERDLSPYGHWVETEYGRCWVPNERDAGWQPYTVGHWEDTDQGWCWVAEGREAEWGVVTYHYGRWYDDRSYGWVWVPGDVWAPAWVAWREGDGYCGWAPLPPQCGEGVNVDVVLVDRYCPPQRYVYCDERYFGDRDAYRHYERNNVTIINRTTNITNITYVDNRVINRGVPVRDVEERSGRRVERVELARANDAGEARRLRAEGRPVAYAPAAVQAAARESLPRLQHAMETRPRPTVRQPANNRGSAENPAQAGGRNVQPNESRTNQRLYPAEDSRAARQRQLEAQDRTRQRAAERQQTLEQQRAQAQAEQRDKQQQARDRQDALRQQRAAEHEQQAQNAAARRQQEAERQQAAREAQRQREESRPRQQPPERRGEERDSGRQNSDRDPQR